MREIRESVKAVARNAIGPHESSPKMTSSMQPRKATALSLTTMPAVSCTSNRTPIVVSVEFHNTWRIGGYTLTDSEKSLGWRQTLFYVCSTTSLTAGHREPIIRAVARHPRG